MRRLERFLGTWPAGLRWALFLPMGIGLSFVVLGIVDMGFALGAGPYRTTPGVIENSTLAFLAGVTRVLFPAVLSPKPWPVGIVMFALDVLLRAGPFAYTVISYEYLRPRAPLAAVVVVAGAAGGCLGLYLVRRFLSSAGKAQATIGDS